MASALCHEFRDIIRSSLERVNTSIVLDVAISTLRYQKHPHNHI